MNFRGTRREDPEINLIPMIDVLLVILIFLMVTTTYSKYAELQINLPTADAEKQPDRPNEINITVSAAGQYTIARKPVAFASVAAFGEAMRTAAAGLKDPIVVIN
ncbi:MAG TPA: biopolymer transporter ExbD, partial [Burkholderiales bacterium]|nr:biopolymer transporter ExbD [Burkholderiales bacterium]